MDRDCENCRHHKYNAAGGYYMCESWECNFIPKSCDVCVRYENCPWDHKGCEWTGKVIEFKKG